MREAGENGHPLVLGRFPLLEAVVVNQGDVKTEIIHSIRLYVELGHVFPSFIS